MNSTRSILNLNSNSGLLKFLKANQLIFLFAILGSAVRIAFGVMHTPWEGAADHVAWEMVLSNTGVAYDTMIHYPHEGGSILMSLVGRFAKLFTDFNSLVISAVIFDLISRLIQLYVVFKLFKRPVFYLFAAFTVFSTPAIIPFGTINFGLHSISSCFPFILMYLIWRPSSNPKYERWCGAFLGLALWFSYSNVILFPIFILHLIISKKGSRPILYALGGFLAILTLHISVRYFADAGFHLHEFGIVSIRGESFSLSETDTWAHLYEFWTGPFSDSLVANPEAKSSLIKLSRIASMILIGGILLSIFFVAKSKRHTENAHIFSGLLLIFSFVCLYSISPFYFDEPLISNYVLYRHLTYIFPLIAALSFWGFSQIKWGTILSVGAIVAGIISTVFLFKTFPEPQKDKTVVGWVLGFKFGHDPDKLYEIVENSNENQDQLYKGCGWGIASALFQDIDPTHPEVASKIQQIHTCLDALPEELDRQQFMQGVHFAFEPYLEPQLNPGIFDMIIESLRAETSTEK